MVIYATSNGEPFMLSGVSQIEVRAQTSPLLSGNINVYDVSRRVGTEITINPGRMAEIVADRVVIRHELTHLLLPPPGSKPSPFWLSEGIAEYVGHLPRTVAEDRADGYAEDIDLTERRRELVDSTTGRRSAGFLPRRAPAWSTSCSSGVDRFLETLDSVDAAAKPGAQATTNRALLRTYGLSSGAVAKAVFAELD